MLTVPPALIAILTDTQVAAEQFMQLDRDHTTWVDAGTAAMNMMLMAQALGLGSCPVTSFSRSGLRVVLDLPPHLIPEFIMILGHPAPKPRVLRAGAPKPVTAAELTYWERVGTDDD
jgi:nitroreductase